MIYRRFLLRGRASNPFPRPKPLTLGKCSDGNLQKAYCNSLYIIRKPYQVWRVGGVTRWRGAVLGAWNPLSLPCGEYRNRRRDQRLLRRLPGLPHQEMWGGNDSWWERHFWVPDLSLGQAQRLAQALDQMAFLYLDRRRVVLVCANLLRQRGR
ncbi:DUF3293 domain-containing protein [Candidatus Igneacidithiobacillus taiwanensis]|uniref:DUF3293 domain-containing protein n=1 Tax=Candidatus Igneacidithiobacillus taiwanensis TaxID=1945924 RepID=UPI002898049A|nr:DUF3293 domain-containing protein [Candidatus Igneacidithiobacillus taiwanensis]MCE5361554.1 DUF3293 domain-containing protein [Acidithiobacillus sp.]